MTTRKSFQIIISFFMLASLLFGGTAPVGAKSGAAPAPSNAAMPAGPDRRDQGPALLRALTRTGPSARPARPIVAVDADRRRRDRRRRGRHGRPTDGAITAITVTNPGSGYTSAPSVDITGDWVPVLRQPPWLITPASSLPSPWTSAGGGYTAPSVTISGGGATTDATATVYGGVDARCLIPMH